MGRGRGRGQGEITGGRVTLNIPGDKKPELRVLFCPVLKGYNSSEAVWSLWPLLLYPRPLPDLGVKGRRCLLGRPFGSGTVLEHGVPGGTTCPSLQICVATCMFVYLISKVVWPYTQRAFTAKMPRDFHGTKKGQKKDRWQIAFGNLFCSTFLSPKQVFSEVAICADTFPGESNHNNLKMYKMYLIVGQYDQTILTQPGN